MQHLLAWHASYLITSFYSEKRFFTLLLSLLRSAYFLYSFWVLRGIEATSSLICSSSSCKLVLAHQFSLICHVYFHISLVFMIVKEEINSLFFVFYAQWLLSLMLSSFLLPHIPVMAEGLEMAGGGWLLSTSFPSSTEIVSRHSGRWELPLWLFTASFGIIRSRFCRIILKGQLGKKSSFFFENTYKYPVILVSVKLMVKELQILLSELFPVQLFQQCICKIAIFLGKIFLISVEREASVILSRVLLGIQPNSSFSYLYFSTLFSFQEAPNATAGACLSRSSPRCWWWCHWISLSI